MMHVHVSLPVWHPCCDCSNGVQGPWDRPRCTGAPQPECCPPLGAHNLGWRWCFWYTHKPHSLLQQNDPHSHSLWWYRGKKFAVKLEKYREKINNLSKTVQDAFIILLQYWVQLLYYKYNYFLFTNKNYISFYLIWSTILYYIIFFQLSKTMHVKYCSMLQYEYYV